MNIGFDFTLISKPYGLRRRTYQLVHMLLCAYRMGYNVRAITNNSHIAEHPIMDTVRDYWSDNYNGVDIYIADANAYHRDINWRIVSRLDAYKVCLSHSDNTLCELPARDCGPVQERCDLYVPVNYSRKLLNYFGHKIVVGSHILPNAALDLFRSMSLINAYLDDDITTVRDAFKSEIIHRACFIGSLSPTTTRLNIASTLPDYVDVHFTRDISIYDYFELMARYYAVVDLRGHGDKSYRFTEAVLLGKLILTLPRTSKYSPELVDGRNCILVNNWCDLPLSLPNDFSIQDSATSNYRNGWSLRSQLLKIIERANE